MSEFDFAPAAAPTFYFIGMTTARSSIMKVFPVWSEYLGLEAELRGIDCAWHDKAAVYRRIVSFIRDDSLSLGALVTTHKIDLLRAARDLFDALGPYAELLGETSSISKRNRTHGVELWGHAIDPITSGLAMETFVPENHWASTGAELCIFGAGGSSLALTTYIMETKGAENRPARIVVTNRSAPRLGDMKRIHDVINPGIPVEYRLAPTAGDNDNVMEQLRPGSLVVNATGLGKDAPGSPLTDMANWPEKGIAWDFNYRGDLVFMEQAKKNVRAKQLLTADGWNYFIYGWTRAIAEIFHIDIPVRGPGFDTLSRLAAENRGT